MHVEKAGWYNVKVTATRGNGCISFDSSYVQLLFNDAGSGQPDIIPL